MIKRTSFSVWSVMALAALLCSVVSARWEDRRAERFEGRRFAEGRRIAEMRRIEAERRYHHAIVYAPAPVVIAAEPTPGINLVVPLSFH